MNVDEFINKAAKNPEGRFSTTRYVLRDKTQWVRDDNGDLHPLVSFMDDFLVDWGTCWVGGSRTNNTTWRVHCRALHYWEDLIDSRNSSRERFPQVRVSLPRFTPVPLSDVKSGTTKSLISGINVVKPDKSRDPELRRSFQEPFEKMLTRGAYLTIKRENDLTRMSKEFVQKIPTIESALSVVEQKLAPKRERYFAPTDEELLAPGNHLDEIKPLIEKCVSAGSDLVELCQTFSSEMRNADANHKGSSLNYLQLRVGEFMLQDRLTGSWSFYRIRENFDFYQKCLRRCGFILNYPWGQHPSQWNYTDIAAPLFVAENS